ncbi:ibr domain-containing protein [Rutstroemia sp. NJR-2017a BVV2]|nr:ibr domain-containing protein [Rutstroemia sp. NJR-2017a BVV2]
MPQCLAAWHGRDDCPNEVGLQDALALAESQGWKRCPKCRAMVSRKDGCRVIHCRCGCHFCYLCGDYCLRNGTCSCGVDGSADAVAAQPAHVQAELQNSGEASSAPAELNAATSSQETQVEEEIERARIALENLRNRHVSGNVLAIHRKYTEATRELDEIHRKQKQLILERWKRQDKQLSDDQQDAMNRLEARSQRSMKVFTKDYEFHLSYLQHLDEKFFAMEEMVAGSKYVLEDLARRKEKSIYSEKDIAKSKKEIRLQKVGKLGTKEEQIGKYTAESQKLVKDSKQARDTTRLVLDSIFQDYRWGMHTIQVAEAGWLEAVIAERQSMLQEMESDEIQRAIRNHQ